MPSRKNRLYVALYARGGQARMPGLEDTYVLSAMPPRALQSMDADSNESYHWALIIGPKEETEESRGARFHAKGGMSIVDGTSQSIWSFEERGTSMRQTAMILVRVLVGKIENDERGKALLRNVPVKGDQPGWNCVGWVEEALEALHRDGRVLGTSISSWQLIRDTAMEYVDRKKREHRFDDQGSIITSSRVPTWDMLVGRETVP